MVTGQGYGLGIGGYKRLCPAATGHSFVTLLSLPVSVKDRSLHKSSRQVTYLLSQAHTYVWALGRLVTLLSWVSALFTSTFRVVLGWRSLHRTKSGTQGRGLGVQVWTGTWTL